LEGVAAGADGLVLVGGLADLGVGVEDVGGEVGAGDAEVGEGEGDVVFGHEGAGAGEDEGVLGVVGLFLFVGVEP